MYSPTLEVPLLEKYSPDLLKTKYNLFQVFLACSLAWRYPWISGHMLEFRKVCVGGERTSQTTCRTGNLNAKEQNHIKQQEAHERKDLDELRRIHQPVGLIGDGHHVVWEEVLGTEQWSCSINSPRSSSDPGSNTFKKTEQVEALWGTAGSPEES